VRGRNSLVVEDLSVVLNGVEILSSVSFRVESGELVAIVGPNGAGKTTLLRVISGILPPSSGAVFMGDYNVHALDRRSRAKLVSYVPAELEAPGLGQSVVEFVASSLYPYKRDLELGIPPVDLDRALKALSQLEVEDIASRRLDRVSSGEKQRALIAYGILREAPVLVVDEPTSFQDLRGKLLVYEVLAKYTRPGRIVVVATHDFLLASRYADKVLLLDKGRVVDYGEPAETLSRDNIARVFRVSVEDIKVRGARILIPVEAI